MTPMSRLAVALLLGSALIPNARPAHAAADRSPVGEWRTFDDGGKESGAVNIYARDGELFGDVAAIADPAKRDGLCKLCTDDRKDRPVLGMQVIRGMKQDGAQWDGGEIVDPQTGKIYRVKMHVSDDGTKLVLRGYVGISLFGRTQTWVRRAQP